MKSALLAYGLTSAVLAACGGGDPPICPTGDCSIDGRTIVRWNMNSYPELLFTGDTCQDLGIETMHVEIQGVDDPTFLDAKDVDCNQKQVAFLGLPLGNYSVSLLPLDGGGNSLAKNAINADAIAGATDDESMITVNFPYDNWVNTYTGTLLFRLSWGGGLSCATATPAVTTQTLTLVAGGQVMTLSTDAGQKLDGSDPKPCRALDEQFAQFAEGLPFGPATFTVSGEDATNAVVFEKVFDTFIGAAKNNPTITYDVEAVP